MVVIVMIVMPVVIVFVDLTSGACHPDCSDKKRCHAESRQQRQWRACEELHEIIPLPLRAVGSI
jgi:hypothetical protein